MTERWIRSRWLPPLLFAAGILALYATALTAGFLNDDHLFLEQARRQGLLESLTRPDALANYFRPLSRQVWFEVLTPLSPGNALGFHLASLLVLSAALVLLYDLLRSQVGPTGAWIGVLWFALLPLQRVNLLWVSCSQDLLALCFALASMALWRRGRDAFAAVACTAAVLSKESALPLPLALLLWSGWVERQPLVPTLRRLVPFAPPLLVWAAGTWMVRSAAPEHAARLYLDLAHVAAAFVHLPRALFGIEDPARWVAALGHASWPILAAVLLTASILSRREAPEAPGPAPRRLLGFAAAWLALFTLPVIPVVYVWSSYYYTLAAVGGALLVGVALRAARRVTRVAVTLLLLVVHAGTSAVAAFSVTEDPWNPVSRLTAHYFERGAQLSRQLADALRRVEPEPAPNTRFFFATLPSWAGFQAGNGAAIRNLYADDTLESWFYSAFTESTAAGHPCVFLFWNGVDFERLYHNSREPFFQVGTDLLLLERPRGAMHAFRRGLDAGESPVDHLYWLGWAALSAGERAIAERAWGAWGARDDSVARALAFERAGAALAAADTLGARRALLDAIRAGIGRPDAHAELGLAMRGVNTKYALLETRVAVMLDPADWMSRRGLVQGLLDARLDDPARLHMETLRATHPDPGSDTLTASLDRRLRSRAPDARAVLDFAPPRPR